MTLHPNRPLRPTLVGIRRMIRKSNPSARNLRVTWVRRPRWVHNPAGDRGRGWAWWDATVAVTADGFRDRQMTVSRDQHGTMVR